MTRANPILAKGYTGTGISLTGPDNFGAVAGYLNDLLGAQQTLHDSNLDTRPDYLTGVAPSIWSWIDSVTGVRHVYLYDGQRDVEIMTFRADGKLLVNNGGWALTEDVNLYLSTTGDDTNDGLTAETALATWPAMHALLASIDPRGHVVTVNISGIQPGDATFALPQYSSANLKLLGTSTETDGFAGAMTINQGSFEPHQLSMGFLFIRQNSDFWCLGRTIRITGITTPDACIWADWGSGIVAFRTCTIEYSGAFTNFCAAMGATVFFRGCTFTPIGSPTFSSTDLFLINSGDISIDIATSLPQGGTITRSSPGNINAYGAAVAVCYVDANGSFSRDFGITSVAALGNGAYDINHVGNIIGSRLATISLSTANRMCIEARPTLSTRTRVYTTRGDTGQAINNAFFLAVF